MSTTMRRVASIPVEPQSDPFAPFRERIASRCVEHDALHPKAVDLEARADYRLHGALTGSATLLAGIHSARRFREMLMGERHFPLADLCRLATSPVREARDAAFGAVSELAAALGYRLEPIDPKAVEAHEALAGLMETGGQLGAEFSRGLSNDGRMDAQEADGALAELEAHKASIARVEGVLLKARATR